jgi:hypothetical protein
MASGRNYRALKKRLNRYHKFTFNMPRKGKDFTPQQKAAITRSWDSYGEFIRQVESGKKSYVSATTAQRRQLQSDFYTTNKGIFVGSGGVRPSSGRVRGRGKATQIEFTEGAIKYRYYPRPDSVIDYEQWANELKGKEKADMMSLAINGNVGFNSGRDAIDILGSPPLDEDGEPDREIVTGVYLIFIKQEKRVKHGNIKSKVGKRKRRSKSKSKRSKRSNFKR